MERPSGREKSPGIRFSQIDPGRDPCACEIATLLQGTLIHAALAPVTSLTYQARPC